LLLVLVARDDARVGGAGARDAAQPPLCFVAVNVSSPKFRFGRSIELR
jgi:hypothetical protein